MFSQQTKIDTNTFGSIDGATALKLDEKYEVKEQEEEAILNTKEFNVPHFADNSIQSETIDENIPDGVSIENASYIETQSENILSKENENLETNLETNNADEEYTPQLFSNESETKNEENEDLSSDKLFDQESNDEEDFEIPAFLRKQKF